MSYQTEYYSGNAKHKAKVPAALQITCSHCDNQSATETETEEGTSKTIFQIYSDATVKFTFHVMQVFVFFLKTEMSSYKLTV